MSSRVCAPIILAIAVSLLSPCIAADEKGKLPAVVPPEWPVDVRDRMKQMQRRVDAWLAESETDAAPLYVVYLSCFGQEPFPKHVERIDRVLTEIQDWFAIQNESLGLGRKTFRLERDEAGRVVLHHGSLPFTVESRKKQNLRQTHMACNAAARAALAKEGVDHGKNFVLVITQIPDDHGAAPYFGNIIQDRGYCFAVDAPWFDLDYTTTDGPRVWKGKPVGPANSALIGGMAHEIGHGFGLPHSDEPPELRKFGESLMASGNYTFRGSLRGEKRDSFLLDTDAMFLLARPLFNTKTRGFDRQPRVSFHDIVLKVLDDGRVKLTGRVESDIPAYAVKLFDDPPGNGNYNAVAHAALPDEKTGAFEITFTPHRARGEHALRLMLHHVNGRWTERRSAMAVGNDGKADVSRANRDWGKP